MTGRVTSLDRERLRRMAEALRDDGWHARMHERQAAYNLLRQLDRGGPGDPDLIRTGTAASDGRRAEVLQVARLYRC